MEIPNKVYLEILPHSKPKEVYKDVIKFKRTLEDDIEYVRTDAFIERALAYLHDKFYFNNVFYGIVSTDFNAMEEMYEDFRKNMKGE